jgi:hypothetical protein
LLLVLLVSSLWSCYPDNGLNSTEDYDVVVTTYKKGVDFSQLKRYAMPDSVYEIEGSEDRTKRYDQLVLDLVVENLTNYGYTRVTDLNEIGQGNFDVLIYVRAIKTKNYAVSGGYWPGWGYPGYPGYPGWGWGYPVYGVSTFTTGSFLIDMAQPDNANEDLIGYWQAGLNGLVSSSVVGQESRITTRVNKAFSQSPYLDTTN